MKKLTYEQTWEQAEREAKNEIRHQKKISWTLKKLLNIIELSIFDFAKNNNLTLKFKYEGRIGCCCYFEEIEHIRGYGKHENDALRDIIYKMSNRIITIKRILTTSHNKKIRIVKREKISTPKLTIPEDGIFSVKEVIRK